MEVLASRTNCTSCDQAYDSTKNQIPKLLTCAHSFCFECLHKNISDDRMVKCMKCNRLTFVGDIGVDTLSDNTPLLLFLDDLKKNPPKTVTTCGNCNDRPVALFCPECNCEICSQCSDQVHSLPMFKNHNPTTDLKPKTENLCSEHNEKLVMFCHSDEVPICYLCKEFGPHQGHQAKLLTEAAKDGRDAALGAQQEVEENIKHISVMAQKAANAVEVLEENYGDAQDKINEHFKKLAEALEKRKNELLQLTTCVTEANTQKLRDQSLGLVNHLASLSLVSEDTTSLVEQDDLTFLRGKNKLKDNIQKELRKAESCELDVLAGAIEFLNILDEGIFETVQDHGSVGAKTQENLIKVKLEAKRKRKDAAKRRRLHHEERMRLEDEELKRSSDLSTIHGGDPTQATANGASVPASTSQRKSGKSGGGPRPPGKGKPKTKGKSTPRPPKKPKKSKHKRQASKGGRKKPKPETKEIEDLPPPVPPSPAPLPESDEEPLPPTPTIPAPARRNQRDTADDMEEKYASDTQELKLDLVFVQSAPLEHVTLSRPAGPKKKKKPKKPKLGDILEL